MESADLDRPRHRWLWVVGIVVGAAVALALIAAVVWPSNERRFEHLREERILRVAPRVQSFEDAVSSHEEIGSIGWLIGTDRDSYVSRSYRLPDDADQRSIILDYGRALHDDDWEDIVIICNSDGLSVRALKHARLRLADAFTMSVTVGVMDGVFLQGPDAPWPTFHPGGLGVNVFLAAPPVRGGPTHDIQHEPPSVSRDSRCRLDSIVGDEGDLLVE